MSFRYVPWGVEGERKKQQHLQGNSRECRIDIPEGIANLVGGNSSLGLHVSIFQSQEERSHNHGFVYEWDLSSKSLVILIFIHSCTREDF